MIGSIGSYSTAQIGNAAAFKAASATAPISDATEVRAHRALKVAHRRFPHWPDNWPRAPAVPKSGIRHLPVRNWRTRQRPL